MLISNVLIIHIYCQESDSMTGNNKTTGLRDLLTKLEKIITLLKRERILILEKEE